MWYARFSMQGVHVSCGKRKRKGKLWLGECVFLRQRGDERHTAVMRRKGETFEGRRCSEKEEGVQIAENREGTGGGPRLAETLWR